MRGAWPCDGSGFVYGGEDTWLATRGCRKGVVVGGFAAAGWWARE